MKKDGNINESYSAPGNRVAGDIGEDNSAGVRAVASGDMQYRNNIPENENGSREQDISVGETPVHKGYGDIIAEMRKYSEVSPDQEEKDRKRHRAMLLLGALSDGIAGIANIFAARKGALPVWHDPVTAELDARYKAILDERRNRSAYWDDMEARARMADMGAKLSNERQQRHIDKMSENDIVEYPDAMKPYGVNYRDKSGRQAVMHDERNKVYTDNAENSKKRTGIDW